MTTTFTNPDGTLIDQEAWDEFCFLSAIGTEKMKAAFVKDTSAENIATIKRMNGELMKVVANGWFGSHNREIAYQLLNAIGTKAFGEIVEAANKIQKEAMG